MVREFDNDCVLLVDSTDDDDSVNETSFERLPIEGESVTEVLRDDVRELLPEREKEVVTVVVWEIVTDFERDSSFEPPVFESEPLPVTDEDSSFVADPNENVLESDAVAEGSSCD